MSQVSTTHICTMLREALGRAEQAPLEVDRIDAMHLLEYAAAQAQHAAAELMAEYYIARDGVHLA